MDVFIERCAGLDVHSETIVACVLTGKQDENLIRITETFPTLTKDLFRLLKWLEDHGVTHIAMESTGVYWKPVFNILEDFFDITLANAQRIKNVPGRKTDVSDAEWIAKLLRTDSSKRVSCLHPISGSYGTLHAFEKSGLAI